ncbi:MAG: histidine phosphatase family protein [Georgfuchsia sp.]
MSSVVSQSMPLCLYLVRHGETEWSLSGRHTGRTDIPLTAHGEDEARELAPRLRNIQFTQVLTSPLKRAQQTCELAGLSPTAVIEPDLAEWDYGDYDGQRSVDIRKQRTDWNIFRDGCPQGEMPAQVSERADRLIAHLRALEGNIALFSHGQLGCVLAARWIGLPLVEAQHFTLGTASLSVLGHDSHQPEVAVIALWNAASSETSELISCSSTGETMSVNPRAIARWENEGGEIPMGTGADLLKKNER